MIRGEFKKITTNSTAFFYQNFVKKMLFQIDPEKVHERMTGFSQKVGKSILLKDILDASYTIKSPALKQIVAGITFNNPVGLSAGFDYEARLTQILPSIGFGFETVGTITHMPYDGNPRPMLGRLPKSKSLMINKGFKNLGAKETIKRIEELSFAMPIGVSIGRTNSSVCSTQKKSIEDIISAFILFEESKVSHSYYELNISCPNLFGDVTFYPPKNLEDLLKEIQKLYLKRPLFMKMPIERSDEEVLAMLKVIDRYSPTGVIFGNLQKNRKDKTLVLEEVSKFPVGNFSGKPTYERSNELIALTYMNYAKRFIIIGCGGIFSAADAYEKIALGASLVQLITGMIYQGPQFIGQINAGLLTFLKRDGYDNISEAIGRNIKIVY